MYPRASVSLHDTDSPVIPQQLLSYQTPFCFAMLQEIAEWSEQAARQKDVELPAPNESLPGQRRRSNSASPSFHGHLATQDWKLPAQGQLIPQRPHFLASYSWSAHPQDSLADVLLPASGLGGRRNAVSIHVEPPSTTSDTVTWDRPQPFTQEARLGRKHAQESIDPFEVDACAMSLAPPPSIRPELTYGFLASLDLSTSAPSSRCSYSVSSTSGSAVSSRSPATPANLENGSSYFGAIEEYPPFYEENTQEECMSTLGTARNGTDPTAPCFSGLEQFYDCQSDRFAIQTRLLQKSPTSGGEAFIFALSDDGWHFARAEQNRTSCPPDRQSHDIPRGSLAKAETRGPEQQTPYAARLSAPKVPSEEAAFASKQLASTTKQQSYWKRLRRGNRAASLPSIQLLAPPLDILASESLSKDFSCQGKVRQQRDALHDLADELEVYLTVLAERRVDCTAAVESRAFPSVSNLLSAFHAGEYETEAQHSSSGVPAWASTVMEREMTPEDHAHSLLAVCKRMMVGSAGKIAPSSQESATAPQCLHADNSGFSLYDQACSSQKLKASDTSAPQHMQRSDTIGQASSSNLEDESQQEVEIHTRRRRAEERCDCHFLEGIATLIRSLLAGRGLQPGSSSSPSSRPPNSFDKEVLSTVSQILARHREDWDLLLAAERRLSLGSDPDGALLAALFAYIATSSLT